MKKGKKPSFKFHGCGGVEHIRRNCVSEKSKKIASVEQAYVSEVMVAELNDHRLQILL